MRVVLLGQYPLVGAPSFGGVEVAIVNAQRELRRFPDLELHIVTCRSEISRAQVVRDDSLTVTYLPRQRFGRITWHYQDVRAILPVLRHLAPDLIHAHGSGFYAGAALASGIPAVTTVHGILSQEARLLRGWPNRLRGQLDAAYENCVIRRARHLIIISPYVEQVFGRRFTGQAYCIENPCNDRFFDLSRRPIPGRLFFSGYVCARKGVLPLLKALSLLRASHSGAHLRIAGYTQIEADYYRLCADYVRHAGLEGAVTFLGQLTQEQILEEYATCAALVLPSFQETAPVVIEEAMAAAVPIIATRAGGVPWMIEHGATGLTLPVPQSPGGDPQALAEMLATVLDDPVTAEAMGQRAKAEADGRFRAHIIARRTYQVYQEVLASGATHLSNSEGHRRG